MRIVVTGGGSGGHITPLLAVCKRLKSPDNQLHYIGLGQARERELVEPSGMSMHRIAAGKLRRYHGQKWWQKVLDFQTLWLNLVDALKLFVGIVQSLGLLLAIKPDRIFIKGGFVGLPVGIAAWLLRKPFIIHESDAVPGLTNRILAKLTPYRLSGFDIPGFVNLGNPVRKELLEPVEMNKKNFGIETDKPIVLVVGGSLGSASLNQAAIDMAENFSDYEIIHITGDDKTTELDKPYYHQYSFLGSEMAAALQLADVVVSRGGANSLSELAALGKASIIVPHPQLSGDHQYLNAKAMADNQAIILLHQSELDGHRLQKEIQRIVKNQELRKQLERGIGEFARINADADIAEAITSPALDKGKTRHAE